MRQLYSVLTHISILFLKGWSLFSKKMKLFVRGRRESFQTLRDNISADDKVIWFHCASLGEYEQGLPIMEAIKKEFTDYKLVVTFFSPSGYENKKDSKVADLMCYLPYDTKSNSKRFLNIVHPSLAVFVKYEFWPNYLFEMELRNIPVLLISGLFRKNQSFFKPHGVFMRKALRTVDHFFLQNSFSEELLKSLNLVNTTIAGDTRFDRVSHQIEQDNSLDFMDEFTDGKLTVVFGSSWPEDEVLFLDYVNAHPEIKFVIAPHIIEDDMMKALIEKLDHNVVRYSNGKENLREANVFILDTIGLLSKVYSYSDIAYVGGAMGKAGLHNILEPATFGVPIIIGTNYRKFPEAIRLESLGGLFSVGASEEFDEIMDKLVGDKMHREHTGMICGHFVDHNTGATEVVMDYIRKLHGDGLV